MCRLVFLCETRFGEGREQKGLLNQYDDDAVGRISLAWAVVKTAAFEHSGIPASASSTAAKVLDPSNITK